MASGKFVPGVPSVIDGLPEALRIHAGLNSKAIKALRVYGQINVYGVTTKSERCERSYRTRSAAGNGIGGREAPVPYGS